MMNRWIGLAAVFFLAAGCGGDGERLEPAAFDLTGDWRYRDVECTSVSDDLPQAALAELDGDLAYEASQHPGLRVAQMGSDLGITYLDDGGQYEATISGDQVEYFVSERRRVNGWDLDWNSRIRGTVRSANAIALVEETELAFSVDGVTGTIGTLCTGRLLRVPQA